ncbi:MAG: hypothetical protein MMC33_006790 [Icmadophila ericetorum]|nr:hypothetical protein [Icmadophila ericetorum]
MCDPLSVIGGVSSVVSVIDIGIRSARYLHSFAQDLKHTDDQLIELSDEVHNVNLVLTEVERTCVSSQGNNTLPSVQAIQLDKQLSKANSILSELEALLRSVRVVSPSGGTKVNRFTWLKNKANAVKLCKDLVDVKQSILAFLNVVTASLRTEDGLLELQDESRERQVALLSHFDRTTCENNDQRNALEALIRQSFMRFQREMSQQLEVHINKIEDHTTRKTVRRIGGEPQQNMGAASKLRIDLRRTKHIGLSFPESRRCRRDCSCICHVARRFVMAHLLRNMLGNLYVKYSSFSLKGTWCSKEQCRGPIALILRMKYLFPSWFLARSITIEVLSSYSHDLTVRLKVRRRLSSTDANLFLMINNGNAKGVMSILESQRCNPNDVSSRTGWTPLICALNGGKTDCIPILLSAGADVHVEDDRGVCALHTAWSIILSTRADLEYLQQLESLFPISESVDAWDLSHIHMIVLGILNLDLESQLQKPAARAEINCGDVYGRTPLWWAANRNDDNVMCILLRYGAAMDIRDTNDNTPLHHAIGSHECTQLLLISAADVQVQNNWGFTPLHRACYSVAPLTVIDTLLKARSSVHSQTSAGSTPLVLAAFKNNAEVGARLFERGACIDKPDDDGDTALFVCLFKNSPTFLKMLLSKGADYRNINNFGSTVLHFTASYGNIKMIRVLISAKLRGLDTEAKDNEGRNVWDIVAERAGLPEGFKEAFEELLESIVQNNATPEPIIEEVVDEDTEEDEFHEALEVQIEAVPAE